MGIITDVVKRYVPYSYVKMIGSTGSTDYYSLDQLQALADIAQYRLFSTIVGVTQEAASYSVPQRELIGIITTLEFIPGAVEYWGQQLDSESLTGSNENVSYRDPRKDLWLVYDHLVLLAEELAADLGIVINASRAYVPKISYGDGGRGILITPEPRDFGKPYDNSVWATDPINWGA